MSELKSTATKYLSEELETREGVKTVKVEPYEKVKITAGPDEGPAVILINQD